MRTTVLILAMITICSTALGSHYLVLQKNAETSTYKMIAPYHSATVTVSADPKRVVLKIDDSEVEVGPSQLAKFGALDVTSFVLARDGYDASRLFLLGSCYGADGKVSGQVVISIVSSKLEDIEGGTCGGI